MPVNAIKAKCYQRIMSQISPAKENSHTQPLTTQQPPQKAQTAFTMSQISPAKENSHTQPLTTQRPPQKAQTAFTMS